MRQLLRRILIFASVWSFATTSSVAAATVVPVAFHVIHNGTEGNVSDAVIAAQISVLNAAFASAEFQFTLFAVDRTNHNGWFNHQPGSSDEHFMKSSLAITPATTLNLYSTRSVTNYATFPWSYPESDFHHGVVVNYSMLPGGLDPEYNQGDEAVHEVGHFMGLYHTYQNGCLGVGDEVSDTPAQSSVSFGCPNPIQDSCPSPGVDPIHNYMGSNDDACRTEFTPGQVVRARSMMQTYRPTMMAAVTGIPEAAILDEGPRSRPNPFSTDTEVRFRLERAGHVQLHIYDASGHRIASLDPGGLAVGSHAVRWNGTDRSGARVANGVYFYDLRLDGRPLGTARKVTLLR